MGHPAGSETPITIVVADDHTVMRSGLRMLLEAEKDFDVVAEAGTIQSAGKTLIWSAGRVG